MIDDENDIILEEEQEENPSNKFHIKQFYHPQLKTQRILSISTSKKYIYLVTDNSQILLIDSVTLRPLKDTYSIPQSVSKRKFKENLTKIWSDRNGNHNIIRYNNGIYYFNSNYPNIKELKNFQDKEICSVDFDDENNEPKATKHFLATDYKNNIYDCNITIGSNDSSKDFLLIENIEKLTRLLILDWEDVELMEETNEEKSSNPNAIQRIERIYGIKFIKSIKNNMYWIIAVTKNRFYQFRGDGTEFKQIFGIFDFDPTIFYRSCKIFPTKLNQSKYTNYTNINILYKEDDNNGDKNNSSPKNEKINQFGWKTDSGYCFGYINYNEDSKINDIPNEQNTFEVVPYTRITNKGEKIDRDEPIDITHTSNHIFMLYKDCITIINKLNSYIIDTIYFEKSYDLMVYNEFSKGNEIIILSSKEGLYQIPLKDENKDIWKYYLEIDDFEKALFYCNSEKRKKRINRIEAEIKFEKEKDGLNAASLFSNSDESFENVCLKYLMKDNYEGLSFYLQCYMGTNLNKNNSKKKKQKEKEKEKEKDDDKKEDKKKEDELQLNLISTWVVEIMLNKKDLTMAEFRQTIRENKNYLNAGLIIQLLLHRGKIKEFIEFASIIGDYEQIIFYFINHGQVNEALERINWFISCSDDQETLIMLSDVFSKYINLFLRYNSKESLELLQHSFKDIKMEKLVEALLNSTIQMKNINDEKKVSLTKEKEKEIEKEKEKEKEINQKRLVSYLRFLIDKQKIEDESDMQNLNNLYLYYLSKNKETKNDLIDYLKAPLIKNKGKKDYSIINKKKGALFQIDFAKRLLKNDKCAYSLVLALMGKYSQGVKTALKFGDQECQRIAKFIASNAPDENIKKKLWIDIFIYNNHNDFKEALGLVKESKILKVEDVLPYITDTIKIEDFQNQIDQCVGEYESNIKKIKENINEYNIATESIKVDINKIKRKPIERSSNDCKCEICNKQLNSNFFLFPCGHIFDINCIKNALLDYEVTGLNYLHDKNVEIDDLFFELGFSKERIFVDSPLSKNLSQSIIKNQEDISTEKSSIIFFTRGKKIDNVKEKKEEEPINNNISVKKSPNDIKKLKNHLFEILGEQCVLCGDFLIDSVQFSLSQKDVFKPDKNGKSLKIPKENQFLF